MLKLMKKEIGHKPKIEMLSLGFQDDANLLSFSHNK